jgi:hypothetical protein
VNIGFGKFLDLTPEQLVLKEPKYVRWLLESELSGSALGLTQQIENTLLPLFDRKPILEDCHRCKQSAFYATGYCRNSGLIYWWCDECDPYSAGAFPGKLIWICSYREALDFALTSGSRKTDYKRTIAVITKAKGGPARVTEQAAAKFFHS